MGCRRKQGGGSGNPTGIGRVGPTAPGPDGHYLGDSNDGEDVSLAERQVLLGGTVEVVLGDTFCTGWPNGLGGQKERGGRM